MNKLSNKKLIFELKKEHERTDTVPHILRIRREKISSLGIRAADSPTLEGEQIAPAGDTNTDEMALMRQLNQKEDARKAATDEVAEVM